MKKIGILIILTAMCIGYASAEELTIRIENVDIGKGDLLIGIYNDEKSFPDPDGYYVNSTAAATGNVVIVTISNLPKGTYVVAIFQDKNGNGILDKVLGIPKEKYCFSNNTVFPDWKKNSFVLNGDMSITVKLR